jgi:opacity protein-like surface antigen
MRTWLALSLATMVLYSPVAWAEAGKWELSLAPGYAVPVGQSSDYTTGGVSLDGAALFHFTDMISAGLESGYIFNAGASGTLPSRLVGDIDGDGIHDAVAFDSDINVSVLHITPQIKFSHPLKAGESTVIPYLQVGGGYYWTHFSAGTITLSGRTSSGFDLNGFSGQTDSEDDTNGGFNIGTGFDWNLKENIRLGVDLRYHQIIYSNTDDLQIFTPALKLTYLF